MARSWRSAILAHSVALLSVVVLIALDPIAAALAASALRGVEQGGPQEPAKLCIFDIDSTLNRGVFALTEAHCRAPLPPPHDGLPGVFARESVNACLQRGYYVGIATAEPCKVAKGPRQRRFLQGLAPEYFSGPVFDTPLVQCGRSNKTESLDAILRYVGVQPRCTIFFDDKPTNGRTAEAMGINWQQASDDDRYGYEPFFNANCGLNATQFARGMRTLRAACHSDAWATTAHAAAELSNPAR